MSKRPPRTFFALLCSAALLGSTALATVAFADDAAAQRRGRRDREPPELEHLTFRVESFRSEALGGDTSYGIFLPKGYDDEGGGAAGDGRDDGEASGESGGKSDGERGAETDGELPSYPLVVWLHGMFEDHRRFLVRGGGEALDRLTGEGEIPKMIFVCADGGRASFYINGTKRDTNYEDMVREELVAHIEDNYRVREGRDSRAIAGVSMGGYGALKIAFKHPDAFGVVAAHSAAILPADPEKVQDAFPWLRRRGASMLEALFGDPIDLEKWKAESVLALARRAEREELGDLRIYFDCGEDDRYGFHVFNRELHEILRERGISHTWRSVEGGGHGWRSGYNQSAIPHSLRFIASQFAANRAKKGLKGLFRSGSASRPSGGDKGKE